MADSIEGYKIAASLVGGGAVGALITAVVISFRNRVQPVGKRLDVVPLFLQGIDGAGFNPSISVTYNQAVYQYANLFVADVQVVNRGNRDMASFSFGLTLTTNDKVIHLEAYGLDRHHLASSVIVATPASPLNILDLVLKPFNRGDAYTFKVFIVPATKEPGPVTLGTSEAVKFTEMPSVAESLAEIASSAVIKIGPLKVGFN